MTEAPFEFFEHTADIGVHVRGAKLEDLFRNAARAMYGAMGDLCTKEDGSITKKIEMAAGTTEDLLHDWLAELLFEAESRRVMYDQFRFTRIGPASLVCELGGRTIDFQRSQATEEIKAVTYHRLRVEQLPGGGWEATVIFDV